jgi:CRISPR-associated autoregulator DevR family
METHPRLQTIYELSINARVGWQAHSLSTAGNNGSNRVMPRRQLLADGSETDACSGNIAKHHHAVLLAEYLEACGCPLCPACKTRDGRRAATLLNHPDYSDLSMGRILRACALCDTHGFLVTAKHGDEENGQEARQRLHKETLIDFSYALALPNRSRETTQLHTRSGASKEEGQMLMKLPARSGEYALLVRYFSVGVGADTERWDLHVQDEQERIRRHQAILRALRDTLVSPDGALTATMLPHLTGLVGVIVVTSAAGRAPVYSALQQDFVERLQGMASDTLHMYPFETVDAFYTLMNRLIAMSTPALSRAWLG